MEVVGEKRWKKQWHLGQPTLYFSAKLISPNAIVVGSGIMSEMICVLACELAHFRLYGVEFLGMAVDISQTLVIAQKGN